MKSGFYLMILIVVTTLAFAGGYGLSVHTGTEPGYFDAVDAAGYGGGGTESIEGISDAMQEYYKSLGETEE